jgi:phosphoglycolate phosphatase
MNAQTKNIVFDWNSTLLDDMHAMHECMNIIMERVGRDPITMEFFRTHYEVPFEKLYSNFGFADSEIENLMNLDRDIFHRHYEPMADVAALRKGASEILDHARQNGLATLILSNHIEGPIRNQLQRLKIDHLFDAVLAYTSHAVQFRDMTKGERLRRFMDKRGMAACNTMIVGDSIEEIQIAHEQNLISVAITGGCTSEERLRAEKPDHVIHDLHELKPILQERGFAS